MATSENVLRLIQLSQSILQRDPVGKSLFERDKPLTMDTSHPSFGTRNNENENLNVDQKDQKQLQTRIVNFVIPEKPIYNPEFFKKQKVPKIDPKEIKVSNLTLSLQSKSPSTDKRYRSTGPSMLHLKIYPQWDVSKPVKVSVLDTDTVDQVISAALQALPTTSQTKGTRTTDYLLKLAERDGTPDNDFPALHRNKGIRHFKTDSFSLCKNPRSGGRTNNQQTERQRTSKRYSNIGYASVYRSQPKKTTQTGSFFIKIFLPNGEYVILSSHKETSLQEVVQDVAKKRHLGADLKNYYFQTFGSTTKLTLDKTLMSIMPIPKNQLKLVPLKNVNDPDLFKDLRIISKLSVSSSVVKITDEESPEAFMFTAITASQYKEYHLVSTDKQGIREVKIMGIDREKIYFLAQKRYGRVFSSTTSKNRTRNMRDVVRITLDSNQSNAFRISFKEGNSERVESYETKTPHEAAEIVARIKFIMQLDNIGNNL
ncbi:target of rapamycin complex 2 subunit mapkap1 [Anaeramoeba flamelloides]|uniref:Target of rapamycin complex 2 subunit mapkap1 n=1 Tax=Anaeramoeba flamelloides TaxID=1746091 RepID=A0AAV8A8H9_9EUKA|nr:target of rapamycin complex 2 subunit mapkap1 [Anaeramoeba flamelloides]KAJ6234006.1 target of rapamycin complex 2 subunit mapkap1 [Anaeramoeba flamelloides]